MTTPLRSSARLQNSLREQVAKALVNKGFALGQLGHIDEAIAVYDDLLTRFKDAPEPSLGELVQKATSLKKPLQPQ